MRILHPLHSKAERPEKFTYPFCYEPHPLCVEAAKKVRRYVFTHLDLLSDAMHGKMFGTLVVEEPVSGQLFFLAAYSGLLANRNDWSWFVPPVYDAQQPDGHFKQTEHILSAMNTVVEGLPADDELALQLKDRRKQMSEELQQWLFSQ
jgi:tRNA pseudouridine32 synthase/23S rRNA pseudouridine746 synthase